MNTEKLKEILHACDHTLLKQDATWAEIKEIIDDGIHYETASVCIPASFVKKAAEYAEGRIKICTVIGFPNGYSTTKTKCFEAHDAVENGASEIDMVINVGWLRDKQYTAVIDEINRVKDACDGRLLKVIVETCLLTEEEKDKICRIVVKSKADYIKTSTGFSAAGATKEDVALFQRIIDTYPGAVPAKKIKAAGGISSLEDAEAFLSLGASRLGTSRIVKIVKKEQLLP